VTQISFRGSAGDSTATGLAGADAAADAAFPAEQLVAKIAKPKKKIETFGGLIVPSKATIITLGETGGCA